MSYYQPWHLADGFYTPESHFYRWSTDPLHWFVVIGEGSLFETSFSAVVDNFGNLVPVSQDWGWRSSNNWNFYRMGG